MILPTGILDKGRTVDRGSAPQAPVAAVLSAATWRILAAAVGWLKLRGFGQRSRRHGDFDCVEGRSVLSLLSRAWAYEPGPPVAGRPAFAASSQCALHLGDTPAASGWSEVALADATPHSPVTPGRASSVSPCFRLRPRMSARSFLLISGKPRRRSLN
jgi:hypothetical protein